MMDDNYCFACGEENPIGLKLKFTLNENKDKIRTEFVPGRQFQGYPDITHGGIISTVLDECMARLAIDTGIDAVTAKMTTKFRKSAKTGEKLTGEARFIKRGTRTLRMEAEVRNPDNEVIAEAEAVFIKMPGE